jgi:hypothetical protein
LKKSSEVKKIGNLVLFKVTLDDGTVKYEVKNSEGKILKSFSNEKEAIDHMNSKNAYHMPAPGM